MLRLGSSEWQATQARYMRSPLAAFPGSATARKGDAASKNITIATGRMWFIIDLRVTFAAKRSQTNLGGSRGSRLAASLAECYQARGGLKGGLPVCV